MSGTFTIVGRITSAESKESKGGKAYFIAGIMSRNAFKEDEPFRFEVTFWGKDAETAKRDLREGVAVILSGELQSQQSKNGGHFTRLSGKNYTVVSGAAKADTSKSEPAPTEPPPAQEMREEDIPF